MNHRLTVTAAIAVAASSVSLFAVIAGNNWFFAGIGAVIIVALAGTATRLPSVPAAATAAALALLAGYPLLASGSWYAIAGGGLLVAAAAASVTRLGLLRVLAAAITYFGALLVYLNLVDASRESLFRIVPTPSVAMTELTLSFVTMTPLTNPINAPSARTITMAIGMGSLLCTTKPVTRTPCRLAA